MTGAEWVFDIVESDGSSRPATKLDGYLMEAMQYGASVSDPRKKEEK
jgi:hypothetical protein